MLKLYIFFIAILLSFIACKENEKIILNKNQFTIVPIDGFLGVKWGESINDVKAKLKDRSPNALKSPSDSPFDLMYFSGFELLNTKISSVHFSFSSNGFSNSFAMFNNFSDSEAEQFLTSLENSLTSKYGQPYAKSNSLIAWQSKDSCSISLSLSKNNISVFYENQKLYNESKIEKDIYRQEQEKIEAEKKNSDI